MIEISKANSTPASINDLYRGPDEYSEN